MSEPSSEDGEKLQNDIRNLWALHDPDDRSPERNPLPMFLNKLEKHYWHWLGKREHNRVLWSDGGYDQKEDSFICESGGGADQNWGQLRGFGKGASEKLSWLIEKGLSGKTGKGRTPKKLANGVLHLQAPPVPLVRPLLSALRQSGLQGLGSPWFMMMDG